HEIVRSAEVCCDSLIKVKVDIVLRRNTHKVFCITPLPCQDRTWKFISPEDTAFGGKVSHDDPDIERVRRGHLNDMENILPFFVIGFLYVFVNPAPFLAVNLYRLFTAARVVHTIVYTVVVIPQPSELLLSLWLVVVMYATRVIR
ncbi:hypothetical protein L9F63_027347, partial [Diploptera punctata]